jgi:hypothetical protein
MAMGNLREIINEGRNARNIIKSRHQERGEGLCNLDDGDRFSAFTHRITCSTTRESSSWSASPSTTQA